MDYYILYVLNILAICYDGIWMQVVQQIVHTTSKYVWSYLNEIGSN